MALTDATTFKAQVAIAATALTTAYKDSVSVAVATEIRNPKHPLRKLDKYFNFDPATGIVSADDAYIDACYAGETPNKGSQFDIITDPA